MTPKYFPSGEYNMKQWIQFFFSRHLFLLRL
jgi:hypothetical protein